MVIYKQLVFFIFLTLSFNQIGFSQYNPLLNITNPSTISVDGYVNYTTTNADPEDARFTLLGDGYFSFESDFSHHFESSSSGYTTTTFFNRRYKRKKPTKREKITGPTGSSSSVNTRISMNPGINSRVSTSWNPCKDIENYFLLIFENDSRTIDAGCIEFYYNDTELSLNSGEILEYGWVSNKTLSSVTGTTNFNKKLKWDFTNLLPGEQRVVYIPMTSLLEEGGVLNVGSKYASACHMSSGSISTQAILSRGWPHDPNTKNANREYVSANIEDKQEITYTIRFQNEGTAPATNVVLEDVIDERFLNLETLEFLDSEYPFTHSLSGNKLEIVFEDINLPGLKQKGGKRYTYDETESYIKFKINTKSNLEKGEILNQAEIIFDDQPAIETNISVVKIKYNESNNYLIHVGPNPVDDILFLEGIEDQEVTVSVYNSIGQVVMLQSGISEVNNSIYMGDLSSGIYYVMVKNEVINFTKKIIKI